MRQSFRRLYYRCMVDPRMVIILAAMPVYVVGLAAAAPAIWLPALAVIFLSLLWGKLASIHIGNNFLALPALPGRPRTICQVRQKGAKKMSCRVLRRSVLLDAGQVSSALPDGTYRTLTHETVIRRLKRMGGITILAMHPAYFDTLHSVLLCETAKRCRRCRQRCNAWDSPIRQFYLVRFEKKPCLLGGGKEIL